ncbi:PDXL2 protein, partial [Eudromia elegans]|nr:PDXL2 protein [Eudromia elegans]
GTLCCCLAAPEEPSAEGLTSTSLLDVAAMSRLEALGSREQPGAEAPEAELGAGSLHAAPSSGFASEENEESKILQPPQYFWEDGGELNDSSVDLGPATDYSFPVSSPKALPKGNGTQVKDAWGTATAQPPAEPAELDSRAPFSSTLEEDEGLLPIDHLKGPEILQSSEMTDTSPGPAGQEDSLFSDLFSTSSARAAVVTEAAVGIQDEDSVPPGSDLGSSMGPGVLPVSSVFSATTARSSGVSEEPFETTVGWEMLEPTELPEMEQTLETPVGTPSPSSSSSDTQTFPGDDYQPSFSTAPWATSDEPALDLAWNDTESATEAVAGERSLSPQPGGARMAVLPTEMPWNSPQVICKDWSNLAGKNYIILNMSDNIDCEEFRLERGPQLLALVQDAFSRQMDGLQERWLISLSKPNENDKHLLMTLAGEQGVIPTKDVLMALGDVKRSLAEIGIQNYSTTTSCQSHPNQPRSDYGKLFVVLVIIGSICAIIIVMGLIYNCWQRRLPKMKNMSHGEELRFVENGCHDNPTLDVASDSQSEMQEKKPSVNGGNTINGPDSWDVLINKQASEEVDVFEEDTHL